MTDLSDLPAELRAEPAAPAPTLVAFEAVSKSFRTPGGVVQALREVDLEIRRGEVFGVIGRSGAGKSTLIRTVNLLERPSAGRVLVGGTDLALLSEAGLAKARRRIGMIFQHFNLLSAKTVAGNIALPLRIAGVAEARIREKVDALLDLVGLADKRDVYPARLSGGQKQRVGIARALVHDPDLLLCDEATSALDPETTQAILALVRRINERLNLTVILITHEMAVIREICDRVAVMEHGRLVETGEVWRVFGDPQASATIGLLRPLVHDLPGDLAAQLRPAAQSPGDATVLDMRFTGGDGPGPDLAAIVAALGGSATLMHGSVERIQGRPQGRLVVAARPAQHLEAALAGLRPFVPRVTVLGYTA